jgi:predicted phosphoribosyltransferase
VFINRIDAAQQLVKQMSHFGHEPRVIVLAIPRGGLPIAARIADALHAPLDIMLTKKIGAPFNPEFAIGAVTLDTVFIDPLYNRPELQPYFTKESARIQTLLKKRVINYRGTAAAPILTHKTVIIVDDGIATGHTISAALAEIKKQNPHKIIIATPVIAQDTKKTLSGEVDEIISVLTPTTLNAIGEFYDQFEQLTDEQAADIFRAFNQS